MASNTIDLCKPCVAEMKRAGKVIRLVAEPINYKCTCFWCGKRRYGATYEILKKERKG